MSHLRWEVRFFGGMEESGVVGEEGLRRKEPKKRKRRKKESVLEDGPGLGAGDGFFSSWSLFPPDEARSLGWPTKRVTAGYRSRSLQTDELTGPVNPSLSSGRREPAPTRPPPRPVTGAGRTPAAARPAGESKAACLSRQAPWCNDIHYYYSLHAAAG